MSEWNLKKFLEHIFKIVLLGTKIFSGVEILYCCSEILS